MPASPALGISLQRSDFRGRSLPRERIVIGPALVKAYKAEQSVAVYPRVVLDDAAMKQWKGEFSPGCAHPHLEQLVKRDRDGQNFIDIFNPGWEEVSPWTFAIPSADPVHADGVDFLEVASQAIQNGLNLHRTDARIHAKYSWLDAELRCRRNR